MALSLVRLNFQFKQGLYKGSDAVQNLHIDVINQVRFKFGERFLFAKFDNEKSLLMLMFCSLFVYRSHFREKAELFSFFYFCYGTASDS